MRPYYEHGGVTIFHGDCREVLPTLAPGMRVFGDPPYGVGKAEWDRAFQSEWMTAAIGIEIESGTARERARRLSQEVLALA